MSVYTTLTETDFSEILLRYPLGELTHFEGIEAGIENTNYFVTTTAGNYVFTLFEKITRPDLDFYIPLLQSLSGAGITCPQPQYDRRQKTINEFNGKPFTLVNRLEGTSPATVNQRQCKAVASELGKLHSQSRLLSKQMPNRRGKTWCETTATHLLNKLSAIDAQLIAHELAHYQTLDESLLPRGIIHADLFRDNVLFENDQLSGIIDFYDACYDSLLLDVAITVNDWCVNKDGELDQNRYAAFISAYQAIRPFSFSEEQQWNSMLRLAAFRFWLSRLLTHFYPPQGDFTHTKNPELFKNILLCHIQRSNQNRVKY